MAEVSERQRVTRLAPSPTGTLHLGNAMTFMMNWALARRLGWRVVLRMEDLDAGRVREGADQEAIDTLQWLGIDWDEGPTSQSADLSPYREALEQLRKKGLIYPCNATRKEIELAASAPHASDGESRYPGINRPAPDRVVEVAKAVPELLGDDAFAWRLIVPEGSIDFVDELHGPQSIDVQAHIGDFTLATKAGLPAYQLAVVVDDARQGVTDVVRGDDLLNSTPRQLLLYRMLDFGPPPRYWHMPLVTDAEGRRMAKRDDNARLTTYLDAHVPGERVVGLLAKWAGLTDRYEVVSSDEFAKRLDMEQIGYAPPRFTEEDQRWLMGKD